MNRHGLKLETAKAKKASFIFMLNQPDARLFEAPIATFLHFVGMTGLLVADHLIACDLNNGVKPLAIEKTVLMGKVFLIGKELLG